MVGFCLASAQDSIATDRRTDRQEQAVTAKMRSLGARAYVERVRREVDNTEREGYMAALEVVANCRKGAVISAVIAAQRVTDIQTRLRALRTELRRAEEDADQCTTICVNIDVMEALQRWRAEMAPRLRGGSSRYEP